VPYGSPNDAKTMVLIVLPGMLHRRENPDPVLGSYLRVVSRHEFEEWGIVNALLI
jgi:hypothetical protein